MTANQQMCTIQYSKTLKNILVSIESLIFVKKITGQKFIHYSGCDGPSTCHIMNDMILLSTVYVVAHLKSNRINPSSIERDGDNNNQNSSKVS